MRYSVIIPVYNAAPYLPGCVASVLANDCADCEILLIDDGSTDGKSPSLCDQLAAQNPGLIRVIHQENRGLGGARNTGLEAARGDYLLFLDSDDSIVPTTLTTLSQAVTQFHADIYSFSFYLDDGAGTLTPWEVDTCHTDGPFRLPQRPAFLLTTPSACCRLWSRDLFLRTGIRFPEQVWYEDLRTSPKLFALADSIVCLPDCLYRYLQRPSSIMHSSNVARNGEILQAFTDILSWFQAKGLYNTYKNELCRMAIDHILLFASVRVLKINPKDPLLPQFAEYVAEQFPDYRQNPYPDAPGLQARLMGWLIRQRHFRTAALLFRWSDGLRGKTRK